MDIELRPKHAARILFVVAAGLILAHIVGQLAEINLGRSFGLSLFELDAERSIPRFFSSITLLLCSGLLMIIALSNKEENRRSFVSWLGLALIFLFLSIDESIIIHEIFVTSVRSALNVSKIEFYAWLYGILLIIFPLAYLRFFLSLPRRTMLLFAIGGSIFIVGAFGFDLVVAYLGNSFGRDSVAYLSFSVVEEALEMGGIIILFYALLSYIGSDLKWVRVRISEV